MPAKYIKKIYISLMSIVLLMLTAVTTTFAWVGFLDTSFFDNFEINLEASKVGEYGLQLSLTGEEGTFSSSIKSLDVKRHILKNVGFKNVDQMTDEQVEKASFEMEQCSVERSGSGLADFKNIHGQKTNKLIRFDLYISAYKSSNIDGDSSSTYYMDAFLDNNLFKGNLQTKRLMRDFTYPTTNGVINFPKTYGFDQINNVTYEMNFPSFTSNNLIKNPYVSGDISVNALSACRLAVQVCHPVDLYDASAYDLVYKTIIYQGGSQYPTYNPSTGEYSFGGILPDEYNLAINDYNNKIMQGYTEKSVPDWALKRGDIEYVNDGITNRIIDSNDSKVGINQMAKLSFAFWYEGWDADCFSIINQNPVSLNLSFSNYHN